MAWKNKSQKQNYSKILNELKNLELKQPKELANSNLKNSIANFRYQLNSLLSIKVVHKMKVAKQNSFENENKPGKWLAYNFTK